MLHLRPSYVVLTLLLTSTSVFAGNCGNGKILQVKEGGWNTNDLMIKIDYSKGNGAAGHKETNFRTDWIRYRSASLDIERLRAIRSLAYLAFSSGANVETFSQSSQCNAATEITLF